MEPLPYIATYTNVPVLVDSPQKPKDPEITFPGILCNCFAYVESKIGDLPPMATIAPGAEAVPGGVAIEWFDNIKHVSFITQVLPDGVKVIESNYSHCKITERFIPYDSHRLTGFWSKMSTD